MLNDLFHGDYNFSEEVNLIRDLYDLICLKEPPYDRLFAIKLIEGIYYYTSEAEFKANYERDWADVLWEEMDDELLNQWVKRLNL